MSLSQLFQVSITVLFVAVLLLLLVALIQFQVRTWREDRQRKAEDLRKRTEVNPALKEPTNDTH